MILWKLQMFASNTKTKMTRFAFLSFFVIYLSCATTTEQNRLSGKDTELTKINLRTDTREVRLGESNYFIQLPDNFRLSEARGKEGQLGYNIVPKDTSSSMHGFIEVRYGNPIGNISFHDGPPKEIIYSSLLNKKVEWRIYRTETGYYYASTNEKGDLNANASSKNRKGIDSLISIISTLKQK